MKRSSSTISSHFGLLLLLSWSSRVALADITCGLAHGYDRGDPAYFYSGDGSLSSFDACSAECQGSSECQSFAFGDDQCLLYAAPLDTNFREQANSPFLFYDRDCQDVKATSTFLTILPSSTAASSTSDDSSSSSAGDAATTTDDTSVAANTQVASATGTSAGSDGSSAASETTGTDTSAGAGATASSSSGSSGTSSGNDEASSGATTGTATGTASSGSSSTSAPSSSSSGSNDTSAASASTFAHGSWMLVGIAFGTLLVAWI